MNKLAQQIKQLSNEYFDDILAIRRHLHQYPELSFQEHKTSEFLKDKLAEWGLHIDAEWVNTGFTCVIDSGKEGPCIGLRADIDALPINEKNKVEYCSKNPGVMHACGHDVHSSSLLGAARILDELKSEWKGKVVLIFQAGEEKLPGGASLMIKEGLLDRYSFDRLFAQHVYPEMEVGNVGFKGGMYMASADEIYIKVIGKGGHAALPHQNIDPIVIASQLVVALQQITSRVAPPTVPTVLSFGKITGMGATNVIPDEVNLEGTLRTMDEKWRAVFHQKIQEISEQLCSSMGATCECEIRKGYPFLVNDKKLSSQAKGSAEKYLGKSAVEELSLRMTAEDFAYFSQEKPVCFYRLGVGNKAKGIVHSVHHPQFNIDEDALKTGMGLLAYICMESSLTQ